MTEPARTTFTRDDIITGLRELVQILHGQQWDGAFWLIQSGAIAAFRALPSRATPLSAAPAAPRTPSGSQDPAPVEVPQDALRLPAVTLPALPRPRVARPTGSRPSPQARPAAALLEPPAVAAAPEAAAAPITGLEIEVRHLGEHQWLAIS